jgi:hypothetical protein
LADEGGTAAAIVETQEPGGSEKKSRMNELATRPRRKPGRKLPLLFLLASLAGVAPSTRADVLLTPYIGGAFGDDVDSSKLSYGGALTFTGGDGGFGFAVDFGFTPKFFGEVAETNNVTTFMGNLVFSSPGRVRVYGSGGIGLFKTRVRDAQQFFDIDSNELGFNAGGGLMFVPAGHIGFQGDIRYFGNLTDPEPDNEFDVDLGGLHFWRATGGVIIKF